VRGHLQANDLGQLLLLKLNEVRWDSSLARSLHRLNPSGVLIDAPLDGGAEKVHEFLFKVSGTVAALPLLALREEGGLMDPLEAFLPPLPSPCASAGKGLAAVQRLGELVGAAMQLLGFNTNFAPLLDLPPTAHSFPSPFSPGERGEGEGREGEGVLPCFGAARSGVHVWESRAFSADPQQMAKCGGAFLDGLEAHKVLACGKHFPGGSGARAAGATEPPLVSKSMAELWREDLVPYRALLPRLPLILVSTAAYKAYDFDLRQSAGLSSKVAEGLLRVKLGYDGAAIAYELESEAVRGTLNFDEAAVQALGAGCDMLLVEEFRSAERAKAALSAALPSGKLPSSRVEQAFKRIQHVKRGLRPPVDRLPQGSLEKLIKQFAVFSAAFPSLKKS